MAFYLFIEGRARESHLCCNGIDIELRIRNVLADDAVQTVNELIAFVGLGDKLGQSLADIDFINETTIAVKTMDGYISLYSNCTYSITSKDCQLMKERYFPE